MGLSPLEETIWKRLFELETRLTEMEQREITHEQESDILRIRLETLESGTKKPDTFHPNSHRPIPRLTKKLPTT